MSVPLWPLIPSPVLPWALHPRTTQPVWAKMPAWVLWLAEQLWMVLWKRAAIPCSPFPLAVQFSMEVPPLIEKPELPLYDAEHAVMTAASSEAIPKYAFSVAVHSEMMAPAPTGMPLWFPESRS